MKLKFWQVDAFSAQVFGGNPAGVVPLETWPDASRMQAIAEENNLAETAFFVKTGPGAYDLRWFTPNSEVDLCGHATLASAHVIFRFLDPSLNEVRFQTRSGELKVETRRRQRPCDVPARGFIAAIHAAGRFFRTLDQGAGSQRSEGISFLRQGRRRRGRADRGVGSSLRRHQGPEAHKSDLAAILLEVKAGSLQATAAGDGAPYDFVSRFFAPYFCRAGRPL